MSQSSVSEQVKELEAAGVPVRRGTRMTAQDSSKPFDIAKFGSDMWLARWSLNAFRNYPLVSQAKGIRFLAHAAKDLPAFVVGVGPSLDKSVTDLKGLKHRAIIVSTDAAFRALLANGVTPDLVVSYDCKDEQSLLWQDVPAHKIPMLFSSCANPKVIASWPGPVLFYNQYHDQDDLCKKILPGVFPELGQLPSAGTVGNMACFAAHAMGCSPVCAVGMDFCYQSPTDTMPWRYRAQDYRWITNRGAGIPDGWQKTEIKELYDNADRLEHSFTIKGADSREFRTDHELTFYLESFTNLMNHFEVPLVNCSAEGLIPESVTHKTPGGDVILAWKKMTVGEAVTEYCKAEWQGGRTILDHLEKIL